MISSRRQIGEGGSLVARPATSGEDNIQAEVFHDVGEGRSLEALAEHPLRAEGSRLRAR